MTRTALAFLISLGVATAAGVEITPGSVVAARLSDNRINESSGLALSLRNPGILWTLNDSGGGPFLFAIDEKGDSRTRFELAGAANFDWEDVACGPDHNGKPALFIGDIGDNLLIRSEVEIYQVEEPLLGSAATPAAEARLTGAKTLRASYPDGRHNAESLLCHPKTGRLFIITKSETGQCGVYAFPEKLEAGDILKLEAVAQFHLPPLSRPGKRAIDNCMSTGACFSPDATHLVVSTYSSLYEWKISPAQTLADAFAQKPVRIVQPLMLQCEAVCFSADGKSLWITSERLPAPLLKLSVEK